MLFWGALIASCRGEETVCVKIIKDANEILYSGHTLILIGRAKRAPHWGVQSRFRVIYIYIYICCRYVSYVKVGGVT